MRMDPKDQTGSVPSWLRKATGWGLLLAGVAGCILPVLPGFPLVIAGLLVLARDYAWAKRAVYKARRWAVRLRRKARARRTNAKAEPTVRRDRVS